MCCIAQKYDYDDYAGDDADDNDGYDNDNEDYDDDDENKDNDDEDLTH